jgi:GGDEF domain-containing protein
LWKLPENLTAAVRYHHETFHRQKLSDSEKMIDLDQDAIIEAIPAMNREMETISEYYDFVFPSAGQLQKNLHRTNLSLSRINTRYFFQTDTFDCKGAMDVKSFRISEMELELGKPLARAKSVKEVLDIVMYQIGRIFEPRLAANDPLTGLKNRWSFERALVNKNEFEIQYGSVFSMLVIRVGGLDRLVQAKGQKVCDDAPWWGKPPLHTKTRRTGPISQISRRISSPWWNKRPGKTRIRGIRKDLSSNGRSLSGK